MERNMETEKILTEEEQVIVDDLEEICEEEIKFERQMKIEKGSIVARSAGPAIEALRSFCDTDKDLAEYVNSIMEEVKQRVANGGLTLMIIKEMYEKLDDKKKDAFENSVENEVIRQKDLQGNGMTMAGKLPLFENLIGELLEKQRERQENKEVPSVEKPRKVKDEILKKAKGEDEKVKGGAQRIDDTLQEAGDSPEVVEVGKKSGEIVNESEIAEGSLREGVDKVITKENSKSESDIRREKWENETDDEKKKKEIEGYGSKLKLEKEELLAEGESIEDRIEELRKETKEYVDKRAVAAMKVRESLSGADTSKLEGFEQGEAKEAIEELAKNARNNLDDAKLRWLLEAEKPDFGDLMNEHKNREITIEGLKEMSDGLEKLEKYLGEFGELSEEMQIEAREEALVSVGKLKELWEKHPEAFYVLAATGILVGFVLLLSAMGVEAPAWLAKEALVKAVPYAVAGVVGIGLLAVGAVYLKEKEHRERVAKMLSGGIGAGVGIGVLGASWLFNEKQWEDFIKGASKADYPDWYKFLNGLFGLGEDEKSKS